MPYTATSSNTSGTDLGVDPNTKDGYGSGLPIHAPVVTARLPPLKSTDGCGSCPPAVVAILEKKLKPVYTALQSAQQIVDSLNGLSEFVTSFVLDDIEKALLTLPNIGALPITDMLNYFTCPLTPMALMWSYLDSQADSKDPDFANLIKAMDPRTALEEIKKMLLAWVEKVKQQYLNALELCPSKKIIRLIKALIDAWGRLEINPKKIAKALITVAYAKAVCGSSYSGSVFHKIEQLLASGTILAGIPAKIDKKVAVIVVKMVGAEILLRFIAQQVNNPMTLPKIPDFLPDFSILS